MSHLIMRNAAETQVIKAALLRDLSRLTEVLFSGRTIRKAAHECRIGSRGSISIRLSDGCYFNHETGEGGDLLTLIQHTLRTDFKDALEWARRFCGSLALPPLPPLQQKREELCERKRDKALAIMKRTVPINGTLAARYLSDKRGISLNPLPSPLRYVAHQYHSRDKGFCPAMVASFRNLEGDIIAAHCTFLDPETADKLQGDWLNPRLIFGSYRGGAIRLTEATDKLALCEGIEDGLSILQCAPDWSVWACAGTSGLRAVQVPEYVREVMICADNDEPGQYAAQNLSQRLVSEGKRVRIATPPQGFKDFNDLLRNGGRHEC